MSTSKRRSGRYGKIYADILTDAKLGELMEHRRGYSAFTAWALGLAWSSQHLKDGVIPRAALKSLYAKPADADLLVKVGLWEVHPDGWAYVKFIESGNLTKADVEHLRREGEIGQCKRWMKDKGRACTCGEHTPTGERAPALVGDL